MEQYLLTLVFKFMGIIFTISSLLVDSLAQETFNLVPNSLSTVSPPRPPSPPPLLPLLSPPPPVDMKAKGTVSHPPPPPRKKFPRDPHHIPHLGNRGRPNHQILKGHNQKKSSIGKKIGLLFVMIAMIMQFAVIGFLVYTRKHISKIKDRPVPDNS